MGEDGPGRGHLCHTDTFLVIKEELRYQCFRSYFFRLELESTKLRNCKDKEEIDSCKDRIETLQEEIENKRWVPYFTLTLRQYRKR